MTYASIVGKTPCSMPPPRNSNVNVASKASFSYANAIENVISRAGATTSSANAKRSIPVSYAKSTPHQTATAATAVFNKTSAATQIDVKVAATISSAGTASNVEDRRKVPKDRKPITSTQSSIPARSVDAYVKLIDDCVETKNLIKAKSYYDNMKQKEIQPNEAIFISLFKVCEAAKNLDEANLWFDEMCKIKCGYTAATYTAIINVCASVSNLKKAEEYFNEILCDTKIKISESVYNSLLAIHLALGLKQNAKSLIEAMRVLKFKIDADNQLNMQKEGIVADRDISILQADAKTASSVTTGAKSLYSAVVATKSASSQDTTELDTKIASANFPLKIELTMDMEIRHVHLQIKKCYEEALEKYNVPSDADSRKIFNKLFFSQIEELNLNLNCKAYEILICICAYGNDFVLANTYIKQAIEKLKNAQTPITHPTSEMYLSLLRICSKTKDFKNIEIIFKEICDSKLLDATMSMVVMQLWKETDNHKKVDEYFEKTQMEGVVTRILCHDAIWSAVQQKDFAKGKKAYQIMKDNKCKLCHSVFVTLFELCAEVKNLPQALEWHKEMQADPFCKLELKNHVPLKMYNLLIAVCGSVRDGDQANAFIEEMREKCIQPDVGTYANLIRANALQPEKVKMILKEMVNAKLVVDAAVYTSLLDVCANNDSLSLSKLPLDLYQLIVPMVEKNKRTDSKKKDNIIHNRLFDSLIRQRHAFEIHDELFLKLFKENISAQKQADSIDCTGLSHGSACFLVNNRLKTLSGQSKVIVILSKLIKDQSYLEAMNSKVSSFIQRHFSIWKVEQAKELNCLTLQFKNNVGGKR